MRTAQPLALAFAIPAATVAMLEIFITVIGGIRSFKRASVGTAVFFVLRETRSDLGSIYLLVLGVIVIAVTRKPPRGLWRFVVERADLQLLLLRRRMPVTGPPVAD